MLGIGENRFGFNFAGMSSNTIYLRTMISSSSRALIFLLVGCHVRLSPLQENSWVKGMSETYLHAVKKLQRSSSQMQ